MNERIDAESDEPIDLDRHEAALLLCSVKMELIQQSPETSH